MGWGLRSERIQQREAISKYEPSKELKVVQSCVYFGGLEAIVGEKC